MKGGFFVSWDMFKIQILLAILTVAFVGCKSATAPVVKPGYVTHVVICWLKTPSDAGDRQELIEVSKSFQDIPGVVHVSTGEVLPSERPVVVSDFDVAIVMTFENQEAMKAYLEHPQHKRAVEETLKPLAQKIVVYDFVIE